jgi:hypothetical protein
MAFRLPVVCFGLDLLYARPKCFENHSMRKFVTLSEAKGLTHVTLVMCVRCFASLSESAQRTARGMTSIT